MSLRIGVRSRTVIPWTLSQAPCHAIVVERHSPRSRRVLSRLQAAGFATLLEKGEDVADALGHVAGFIPYAVARIISWALKVAGIGAKGVARQIRIANSFGRSGVMITVGVQRSGWRRYPVWLVAPRLR